MKFSANFDATTIQHYLYEHKVDGLDNLQGRLLKLCATDLSSALALLFHIILIMPLHQGAILQELKTANIVPIHTQKTSKISAENNSIDGIHNMQIAGTYNLNQCDGRSGYLQYSL